MGWDVALWLPAAVACRKALSTSDTEKLYAGISELTRAGAVPRFVQMLGLRDREKIQIEAAWVLTNITSGTSEHCACVVSAGALPPLWDMLYSSNADSREQALWCIANVAGDSDDMRACLHKEAPDLALVLRLLQDDSVKVRQQAAWAVHNLCRSMLKLPPQAFMEAAVPQLTRVLQEEQDEEVLKDSMWALSYLADGQADLVGCSAAMAAVAAKVSPSRSSFMRCLLQPGLRLIDFVAMGSNEATQGIVDAGLLFGCFTLLLQEDSPGRAKEVCRIIDNIARGTPAQAQAIFDAGLVPYLIKYLQGDDIDLGRQAAWALANTLYHPEDDANTARADTVIKLGCLPAFQAFLTGEAAKSVDAVGAVVQGLESIAKEGARNPATDEDGSMYNPYLAAMEAAGLYTVLQALQAAGGGPGDEASAMLMRYPSPKM